MDEQIRFENHLGEQLVGTLHRPEAGEGRPGVVLGHCFTCSRHTGILRDMAEELTEAGLIALRFDFSGNGQSQGAFAESTYSKQISEMQSAIDRLQQEGATWIGLAGHSLGAAVSLLTAAKDERVGAVCALAGRISGLTPRHFLSAEQIEELDRTGTVRFTSRGRALKLTEAFFADADQYELSGVLAGLHVPLMVVHGDADEIIPVAEAHKARKANPEAVQLEILPGADHMFSDQRQRREMARKAADWFHRQADRKHGVS
ncbi:MAG: alpha/beta fold hydrolase [Desulfobacterales bacterium]|jgi:putative redox protein